VVQPFHPALSAACTAPRGFDCVTAYWRPEGSTGALTAGRSGRGQTIEDGRRDDGDQFGCWMVVNSAGWRAADFSAITPRRSPDEALQAGCSQRSARLPASDRQDSETLCRAVTTSIDACDCGQRELQTTMGWLGTRLESHLTGEDKRSCKPNPAPSPTTTRSIEC